MKKIILSVFILLFLIPFVVKAESGKLYDVLQNAAENETYAKEYTGEHHDSFTLEPSKKIYHWYAETDEVATQILDMNNVIFANFCWQIIRTTDTGGVKMIYNGVPTDGKCNNTGTDQSIMQSSYNYAAISGNSLNYAGYKYNTETIVTGNYNSYEPSSGVLFGSDFTYSNGTYTLTDTVSSFNSSHRYTCLNRNGICSEIKYYYHYFWASKYYVTLTDGKTIEEALHSMLFADNVNEQDSTIKTKIDEWYSNNLTDYTNNIEDTIFCNDRTIYALNGWDSTDVNADGMLRFNTTEKKDILYCSNKTDQFSLSNSKAQLTYPIALATESEMYILGNDLLRSTGERYWVNGPTAHIGGVSIAVVTEDGSFNAYVVSAIYSGVRPAISIRPNTRYLSGNGSKNDPYILDTSIYYDIDIEEKTETKEFIIESSDFYGAKPGNNVTFRITPKEGYNITSIKIIDGNNNEISFTKTDNNNEYKFTMPETNVKIIPVYEKISETKKEEKNPNTTTGYLIISLLIISFITFNIFNKKKKFIS